MEQNTQVFRQIDVQEFHHRSQCKKPTFDYTHVGHLCLKEWTTPLAGICKKIRTNVVIRSLKNLLFENAKQSAMITMTQTHEL
jgi:hypothetical protein